jgi:hypothetical protein
MASKNMMIGTGAALAGLGGIAAAAVVTNPADTPPAAKPAAKPIVETQTVIVRKVEHRVVHLKPKHRRASAPAASAATTLAPAPAQPQPVVQAQPVGVAVAPTTHTTAPVRTRTSGGSGSGRGGDDAHETGHGGADDSAEHADD